MPYTNILDQYSIHIFLVTFGNYMQRTQLPNLRPIGFPTTCHQFSQGNILLTEEEEKTLRFQKKEGLNTCQSVAFKTHAQQKVDKRGNLLASDGLSRYAKDWHF